MSKNDITIHIVTPFYKGNQYMNDYANSLKNAINHVELVDESVKFIVTIVNDSPEVEVETLALEPLFQANCTVSILPNEMNCGIHQSRVNGILSADSDFILMLDQDDLIGEQVFTKALEKIATADVLLMNGIYETAIAKETIYRDNLTMKLSIKEKTLIYTRNLIISPGQTLIRTTAIPKEWFENICSINGADDYMLWLLMFDKKVRFRYTNDSQYIHRYTSMNLSNNEEKMNDSSDEVMILLKNAGYPLEKIKLINKRRQWKKEFKDSSVLKKIVSIMTHPIIFTYNLVYMVFWNGYKFKENDFN